MTRGRDARQPIYFLFFCCVTLQCAVLLCGCEGNLAQAKPREQFPPCTIWTSPETKISLDSPRSIAPTRDGMTFVLDASSRVHRMDPAPISFSLPESRKGSPGGNPCFDEKENVLIIADTHYHRILTLDPESGNVIRSFGEYGKGNGEFIYPLAVALGPEGKTLFVSEYGGDDRIQMFTRTGKWLGSFGTRGSNPGELDRPCGMVLGPDQNLYVADSCNHRVQVFDPEGNLLRVLDGALGNGGETSRLRFPFGVAVEPLGADPAQGVRVWVVEYGSSRITALGKTGAIEFRFDTFSCSDVESPIQLTAPRGIAIGPTRAGKSRSLHVADTGNHRILSLLLGPIVNQPSRWDEP